MICRQLKWGTPVRNLLVHPEEQSKMFLVTLYIESPLENRRPCCFWLFLASLPYFDFQFLCGSILVYSGPRQNPLKSHFSFLSFTNMLFTYQASIAVGIVALLQPLPIFDSPLGCAECRIQVPVQLERVAQAVASCKMVVTTSLIHAIISRMRCVGTNTSVGASQQCHWTGAVNACQ